MKLNKMLMDIKKRPGLYLGYTTLEGLYFYINGYLNALNEIKNNNGQVYKIIKLFDEFQIFIQNRYNIKSAQSWFKIISFYSNSDYEAFNLFFELYEEFLKEYKELQ